MTGENRLWRTVYRVETHTPLTQPEVDVKLHYWGTSLTKALWVLYKAKRKTTVTQAVALMFVKAPRRMEWVRR